MQLRYVVSMHTTFSFKFTYTTGCGNFLKYAMTLKNVAQYCNILDGRVEVNVNSEPKCQAVTRWEVVFKGGGGSNLRAV